VGDNVASAPTATEDAEPGDWRGNDRVASALREQRDLYKFVHDQSVRMMNQGYTPADIAGALMLPSLAKEWSARGYYGTLSHSSKAVYQKYIGWYDGNPKREASAHAYRLLPITETLRDEPLLRDPPFAPESPKYERPRASVRDG